MKKDNNFNFESALEALENIVKTMEQGELSLDKSLSAFEEGIKLTRDCQQALKQAEQRVLKVQKSGNVISSEPFQELQND